MSRWNGYDEDGDLALNTAADRGEVEQPLPCETCGTPTFEDERSGDRCDYCEGQD
jgi:hypothetical protein